jgi:beta-lactamase regulating signal transducer with metallopeptidase domain
MIATSELMQTLAWSLLHFLWQGAAIAAVAAAVMFVLRTPSARYLVGISALVLMVVSFVITFSLISGAPGAAGSMGALAAPAAESTSTLEAAAIYPADFGSTEGTTDSIAWIARGWLAGVFLFALRIAFGLMVLEQLRRRNLVALPDDLLVRFRILQHRLGIHRAIRYCECHLLRVPAVIGFFRPVVLLPVRALTGLSVEQLEAVVAHELGHIKRFDVAVNFFQVLAETLFFFHPAVWWLNKRIRADREDCCDDVAITACGSTVGYARALATMEDWRDVPNFAMAATGSPVAARVARLLGMRQDSTGTRTAGVVTASLVLATALLAGAVSIGVVNPAVAQIAASADTPAPVDDEEPIALADVEADVEAKVETEVETEVEVEAEIETEIRQPVKTMPEAKPLPAPEPVSAPRPVSAPKPPREPSPPNAPNPPAPAAPAARSAPPFIQDMSSVGLDNVGVDMLIALRTQGVTSAFVRDVRTTGLDPDADMLLAMKIHDVTPAYVKEVRAMGFDPRADEVVAMKIHGLTPEYVKDMRALGFNPRADELIAMKIHGITPDYVKSMRAAGFDPNSEGLIAMKVHDVTPEYRKALEGAGFKLSVDELIQAKVMDITPQFVARASSHGFKNLSIRKLIALKNADIL